MAILCFNGSDFRQYYYPLTLCCNCHSVNVDLVRAKFRAGGVFEEI